MSSFITTDYTVLAIVDAMERHGFIEPDTTVELEPIEGEETGPEMGMLQAMAEALRGINEEMTAGRYAEEIEHTPVDMDCRRSFTDAEAWMCCKCWLYQVDTGEPMLLEAITLVAAVRLLKETIEAENLESGKWKRKCYFGNYHYFEQDPETEAWGDIEDDVMWDLAA